MSSRTVDIKKRGDARELHPAAVYTFEQVNTEVLADALLRLAGAVARDGFEDAESQRAEHDLLRRRAPRLREERELRRAGESPLEAARRLVLDLDRGVLALQGPPGSGKTYTGARMIVAAVSSGRRVGVTALSHKVIRNLLDEVARAASEVGVSVRLMQKPRRTPDPESDPVQEVGANDAVVRALSEEAVDVVGGTAWLWAREELAGTVDLLFIDEAGQMPLANVLATAQAARSLVLLGDPQQLEQPQQGSHPEGTGVSALEHLLDGRATMPPERGLFLGRTWRLHPSIYRFTSELFYEGRLESRPDLGAQALEGCSPFDGSGLWFVPVAHSGNQSSSPEEADRIAEIVELLVRDGSTWRDAHGESHPVGPEEILIVAPYNAQVGLIRERLPEGARVGTVDRFQGQQAPIVLYSMTSSSVEDAPRGMDFLYSPNRLNVATSRARCACILVGSPALLAPDCGSPAKMRLANAFCRYAELAVHTEC